MLTEDPDPLSTILLLLILVLLSAFFSAAEVAFVSLSPARLRALTEENKSRVVRLIAELKAKPQRIMITILIGNNLLNTLSAGLATVAATKFFGSAGLGIATGVMTVIILIFSEITPKVFAQKHSVSVAKFSAFPIYWLQLIFTPFAWPIEKILTALGAEHIEGVTEEEVRAAVAIGTEGGQIEQHERELIHNVLEFTDTRVEEVMTPRVEIQALEKSKTVQSAMESFIEYGHSRMPVYDKRIDQIIGIISLKDLLEHRHKSTEPIVQLIVTKPIFTPASRPLRSLFREFQARRMHMAVVVDEHGGTLGLVTLEDLLEEIVGEIEDEGDVPEDPIQKINSRTALALGSTQLYEIDEILETELAVEEFENKNLAFLILEKLGRMPKLNDRIRFGGAELTVEELSKDGLRIEKVKVEKI